MSSREEDPVLYQSEDGVAVLTLNRPSVRNAFSLEMGTALGRYYRRCDADDAIRAVVVTGTPPAFCAGADLSGGEATFARRDDPGFRAAGVEPSAWEIRKPVIGAVNGHAVGIGLTLALQCDFRVVAEDAKLGIVQVRRGVLPDAWSHWTLSRIAGLSVAADLLLSGRIVDGREATALGLASSCHPADEVLPHALARANDIAANTAPLSVAISKRLLWDGLEHDRRWVGKMETEMHHEVMGRPDAVEGVKAYVERRPPNWQLRVGRDYPPQLDEQ